MKIAIVTDAWFPQVNGVVRTLAATVAELTRRGYEIELITPQQFLTVPLPGYASIDIALAPRFNARRLLGAFAPDIVHIVTEGPIGWSARAWCLARKVPFTTAFHTRLPDYVGMRLGISAERVWPVMARFHRPAHAILVAAPCLARELERRNFANVRPWGRGVDADIFMPVGAKHPVIAGMPGPILLNVGRVAPEKNLEAFLTLDVPGTKVVVGDGPALPTLKARFPEAHFLGALSGEALASAYRAADCFVFPSLTDTFGLVVIEALACGVPVAGFPVHGPIDILGPKGRGVADDFPATVGCLDADLAGAIGRALRLDRSAAAVFGRRFTWAAATDQFIAALHEARARFEPQRATPEPRRAAA